MMIPEQYLELIKKIIEKEFPDRDYISGKSLNKKALIHSGTIYFMLSNRSFDEISFPVAIPELFSYS